jgi:Protein of unknown function (DUF2721)
MASPEIPAMTGEPAMFSSTTAALSDIAHVIQLAIAPVFLLNAVGAIIGVLAARLARIVDRMRILEESAPAVLTQDPQRVSAELSTLERRMHLIYVALGLDVLCALFVGSLIVLAFSDAFLKADLARPVAVLFVCAMLSFISSLIVFLREIFLAVGRPRHRIPPTETTTALERDARDV